MLNWNDNKILDTEWCTLFVCVCMGLQFIIFFLSISYINNLGDDDNLQICLFYFILAEKFLFWGLSRIFLCVCVRVCVCSSYIPWWARIESFFCQWCNFCFVFNFSLCSRIYLSIFVFLRLVSFFLVHVIVYHYFDVCVSVSV